MKDSLSPRASLFAVCLATCGVAACGGLSAPDGPNGGPNTVSITVNSVENDYDRISVYGSVTGTTTLNLGLSGHVDAPKNASDGGFSDTFQVRFDLALLRGMTLPFTVAVDGRLVRPEVANNGQDGTWTNGAQGSAAVRYLDFKRLSFGLNAPGGFFDAQGTVTFSGLDADTATGQVDVRMGSSEAEAGAGLTQQILGSFDVTLTPEN